MKLSREEVIHIATLARVGVSEKDIENFREQLSNILESFQALQQVDTSNVPPTAQAIALQNVIREDEVVESMSQDDVLANAPHREENFFKIKAVLE